MKRFLSRRLTVAAMAVPILISAVFVYAMNKSQIDKDLKIVNKTKALVVESVVKAGGQRDKRTFNIAVKNSSEKSIVSYCFRVADGTERKNSVSRVERSGVMDGWSLQPKKSDINFFSVAPKSEIVITLAAVLFEDGTTEGDYADIVYLQEISAGVKMAYQQIVPLLRQASSQDESITTDKAVQSLEETVSSISDANVPENSKAGFIDAKNFVSREIKELKGKLGASPTAKYTLEIGKQSAKIEKALARLEDSNKSSAKENK